MSSLPTDFTVSTYRMQLYPAHKSAYGHDVPAFGFDAALQQLEYLASLGISCIYLPPIFTTNPGSLHGYDVADHSQINPELGGMDGYKRFTAEAQRLGLEQIADIVPNHMSTGSIWWQDVLRNGKKSLYAGNFDIDWNPPHTELTDKVLAPILGGPYETELKDIKIQWLRGELRAGYWAEFNPPFKNDLPLRDETIAALIAELERDPNALDKINADPVRKNRILKQQHYVLADYRDANEKLNYRCFFDIHGLPSSNIRDPKVFAETHKLILDMMGEGSVKSVRVDHPDGLTDPAGYEAELTAHMPHGTRKVFEKIYEDGELQAEWNIDGDTGYRFMHHVGNLLIDARNDPKLTAIYQRFTDEYRDYQEICHEDKLMIMKDVMANAVNRTGRALTDGLNSDGVSHIQTDDALREIIANFHVYRTYVRPADGIVSPQDQTQINRAVEDARARRPDIEPLLFDQIHDVLSLKNRGAKQTEFIERFQQATGPIMAKAVEDTAYYQYNRFLPKNEVGNCPEPRNDGAGPATLIQEFYDYAADVQAHSPRQMNATSTHDTKRSEDIRARLSVLSEIPDEWERKINQWAAHNEVYKIHQIIDKAGTPDERKIAFPDRNLEYAVYQTMVGAWPIDETRMQGYLDKAMKEAKQHTSWLDKDEGGYEKWSKAFVSSLYADKEFMTSMDAFMQTIAAAGYKNSLTQTLLKDTSPGIPDSYQGNEGFNFRNVDPDNRQPVDFGAGKERARTLAKMPVENRLIVDASGDAKEWMTAAALAVRHDLPSVFGPNSTYAPGTLNGPNDHIVAQIRGDAEGPKVIAVAPIQTLSMPQNDTTTLSLPSGQWVNRITGDIYAGNSEIAIADLLAKFPTALLARSDVEMAATRPGLTLLGHTLPGIVTPQPDRKPVAVRIYTPPADGVSDKTPLDDKTPQRHVPRIDIPYPNAPAATGYSIGGGAN